MTLGLLGGGGGTWGPGHCGVPRCHKEFWALQGTLMGPQAYLAGWEAPGEPRFYPGIGGTLGPPRGHPGHYCAGPLVSSHSSAA